VGVGEEKIGADSRDESRCCCGHPSGSAFSTVSWLMFITFTISISCPNKYIHITVTSYVLLTAGSSFKARRSTSGKSSLGCSYG
jgi:hypothetical protein